MNNSRLEYIHQFRAIAIFFIVSGHAINIFSWDSHSLERIFRMIFMNGSVLFVFIAGYLFQHLSSKFTVREYYLNKFKNVLVPYILLSIPALIISLGFIERANIPDNVAQGGVPIKIIWFLMNGTHLGPYWFIPMISIFYIAAPAFYLLDKKPKFYLCLPLLVIISLNYQRGFDPIINFIHFLSIYIMGMFFSKYRTIINNKITHKYIMTILLSAVLVACYFEYNYSNQVWNPYNYLQKVLLSILIIALLYKKPNLLARPSINLIATYSFGIFFLHSYITSAIKYSVFYLKGEIPGFHFSTYLLSVFFTIITCIIIIRALKIIFGNHSKLIVGA